MNPRSLLFPFAFLLALIPLSMFSSPTRAADQSVSFVGMAAGFQSTAPVLDGGDDVITFTGLAPGLYDFVLTLSGQGMVVASADLNGVTGTIMNLGQWSFVGIDGTSGAPLALTIGGTASTNARYSGDLTVSAVPEVETYALMLAGLACIGVMRRRRR